MPPLGPSQFNRALPRDVGAADAGADYVAHYPRAFSIGWSWYPGIHRETITMHNKTVQGETGLIGGMLKMTPPVIPVRGVRVVAVRQGIAWAQNNIHDRFRVIMPVVSRR